MAAGEVGRRRRLRSRLLPDLQGPVLRTPLKISPSLQSVQSKARNTESLQKPSTFIIPFSQVGQQQTHIISRGNLPPCAFGGKRSICEICDCDYKNPEQLHKHMVLIHKMKKHSKLVHNLPLLNCKKCQYRFFTDQGVKRHFLGTHGLVASSVQKAANKGKDAGCCPLCGKEFKSKLLNHVNKDHKMTLKPAHLSYKCTGCTATFNMCRLFENHFYSEHFVLNKNKWKGGRKQGGGSGSSNSPPEINVETPILFQSAVKPKFKLVSWRKKSKGKPAVKPKSKPVSWRKKSKGKPAVKPKSKPVSWRKKSKGKPAVKPKSKSVSSRKKSKGSPTVSKEKTVIEVGSQPTRRSSRIVTEINRDKSSSMKAIAKSEESSDEESKEKGLEEGEEGTNQQLMM